LRIIDLLLMFGRAVSSVQQILDKINALTDVQLNEEIASGYAFATT
jgi:hypothetical protein